jgi:hypothetical protein
MNGTAVSRQLNLVQGLDLAWQVSTVGDLMGGWISSGATLKPEMSEWLMDGATIKSPYALGWRGLGIAASVI